MAAPPLSSRVRRRGVLKRWASASISVKKTWGKAFTLHRISRFPSAVTLSPPIRPAPLVSCRGLPFGLSGFLAYANRPDSGVLSFAGWIVPIAIKQAAVSSPADNW